MTTIIGQMMIKAHEALANAYAPYSKFTVGSCIYTENGNYYSGVNVENSSYGLTVCAETSAICSMVSAGEHQIKSMVVLAGTELMCPPCGACRQRIHEFAAPDTLIHLCNKETVFKSMTLNELLPLAFDFNP